MIDRVVIEYLKGDSIIFRVLTTYKSIHKRGRYILSIKRTVVC